MIKLFPSNMKFRKYHKGYYPKGISKRGSAVNFGKYGIKAIDPAILNSDQIESVRRVIMKKIKKIGRLYIRVFPDIPVTKKPIEVRMGKGKGNVEYWVTKIEKGRILFEMSDIDYNKAKLIHDLIKHKLPMKSKLSEKLVNFN
uniref:Ribosomal protein L16 n=1 Tax=Imasa heleensis TaxID=2772037 RepID=A0A893DCZ9_9EUKA|nr:ribosomal protein L16 [Imasa heleensis]QRR29734.1 ribosomal protein L16 [Imasa heleensis]